MKSHNIRISICKVVKTQTTIMKLNCNWMEFRIWDTMALAMQRNLFAFLLTCITFLFIKFKYHFFNSIVKTFSIFVSLNFSSFETMLNPNHRVEIKKGKYKNSSDKVNKNIYWRENLIILIIMLMVNFFDVIKCGL